MDNQRFFIYGLENILERVDHSFSYKMLKISSKYLVRVVYKREKNKWPFKRPRNPQGCEKLRCPRGQPIQAKTSKSGREYFRIGVESYLSLGRVGKRKANSVSTFGRFRLWTSFESSPVSVKRS